MHRLLLRLLSPALAAALAAQEPDPDLPQPLDLSVAAPLLEKPPFTRPLDLAEKLQLTGIAYVEGRPVATLLDRDTKQHHLVTETPNAFGWRLAEATPGAEPKLTTVTLLVGAERVTIRYGGSQLVPTSSGRTGPSTWPSNEEAIRNDENGKPYVRASVYLSDADRDRYRRGWSREGHDKFRDLVRNNREMMFKASPQERAAYAKKVFDQIDAQERARGAQR